MSLAVDEDVELEQHVWIYTDYYEGFLDPRDKDRNVIQSGVNCTMLTATCWYVRSVLLVLPTIVALYTENKQPNSSVRKTSSEETSYDVSFVPAVRLTVREILCNS